MGNCTFTQFLGAIHSHWLMGEVSGFPEAGATWRPPRHQCPREGTALRRRIPFLSGFSSQSCQTWWQEQGEETTAVQESAPESRFLAGWWLSCFLCICYVPMFEGHFGRRRWLFLTFLDLWSQGVFCLRSVLVNLSESVQTTCFCCYYGNLWNTAPFCVISLALSVKDNCFFSLPSVSHHILYCQAIK